MSTLLIFFLLICATSLQTLLSPWSLAGSMEWPLLTGVLIYISLRATRTQVIFSAVLAGLLYDSFSPAPLGLSIPFFVLIGTGLFALNEELFADQPITYLILGLLAVPIKILYFALVLSATGLRSVSLDVLFQRLGGGLLLGMFCAPLVYFSISFLSRLLPEKRRQRL